jgi:hypothetical protein
MRAGFIFIASVLGGFFLMWPLGRLFEFMHWPVFHTWGLVHGGFIIAWPLLSVLVFVVLWVALRILTKSKGTSSPKSKHDLAYVCFLPPGIVSLISAVRIGTAIPMNSEVAGGTGFLVQIPLSILALVALMSALVSVPVGIYLSIVLRRDVVLPILSVLTILVLTIPAFNNATVWGYGIYGILVMLLEANWFLRRRWRAYPV